MDDLNAQQIVLLTLLVSFVTSIATGITTVSLLEQAPEPVTQTINRVVEKTVERVVMEPNENQEKVIEKEVVTVVVNEEDLTIEAVEKNSDSLVRVYSQSGDLKNFVALGIIVNKEGDFVTVGSGFIDSTDYIAVYPQGEKVATLNKKSADGKFALLSIKESLENQNPNDYTSAIFANSDVVKLGQSVISLSGETESSVSTGIINSINKNSESGSFESIKTSVSESNVLSGSVILNLKGEIVGIKISLNQSEKTSFMPSNMVKNFLLEGEQAISNSQVDALGPESKEE